MKNATVSIELLIQNQSRSRLPRTFLSDWVSHASVLIQQKAKRWPKATTELTLVFLDPKPARELNLKFRKKNYATDILSFESSDPESLGELVICCDVVQRQAKEHAHSYQLELGYMLIHGILHLLGYDHESGGRQAKVMYSLQDEVFEKMRQRALTRARKLKTRSTILATKR